MRKHPLFLGIDLGTSNVRSAVFTDSGKPLGYSIKELTICEPLLGWAEEDPKELWSKTLQTAGEATKMSGCSADDVVSISFSGQMHSISAIDKKGGILFKLVTGFDQRSGPESEALNKLIEPRKLYEKTGCPPLFSYILPKILWFKNNKPNIFHKVHKFLSAKDYVIYKMLGEALLDHSTASGSQLLNINTLKWDNRVLEIAGIGDEKLPILKDGIKPVGELPASVAKKISLRPGIPIVLGASDGALSSVGLNAIKEGAVALDLGSSGAIRASSSKPVFDKSRQMRLFCYYLGMKKWLVGGAINNAGYPLRWFKNNFALQETREAKRKGVSPYQILDSEAEKVEPGSEGLLSIPFFSGERFPVRDYKSKGVLFGLTYSHSRAHLARAIMEGVAFTLKSIMEVMEEQRIVVDEIGVSGGGVKSELWKQILADVLGKTIAETKVKEASVLGSAILGAISYGAYRDLTEACDHMVELSKKRHPVEENKRIYSRYYEIYKDLYQSCKPFFNQFYKQNL
ncbi:MAG TPA: hypothetical protein HA348_05440 [Thermoplasmata archaeon]|nr:hypothetical protein [Thermoplasmata archaeon]